MAYNVDGTTTPIDDEDFESYSPSTYEHTSDNREPETRRGDSADEVDPRKLVNTPTVEEIRWYANNSFAGTIVNKPVDDAFKNGFEVVNDNGGEVRRLLENSNFTEEYKLAEKKARRDGFALLHIGVKDTAPLYQPPRDVFSSTENSPNIDVLSLDDMAETGKGSVDDKIPYEREDYEVTEEGIVMVTKLGDERFKKPVAYLVDQTPTGEPPEVVHHSRVIHLAWNEHVDGPTDETTFGRYRGDSILQSSFHLFKGLSKGNWAIMQTIFRYAAKLYAVEMPEDATDEDYEQVDEKIRNLNAMSELVLPSGYEIEDFQTDGQMEPREYFDVIFEQICAGTEMTKSVLFGTQQGTVTGSETDIKNYFNQVHRYRTTRVEDVIEEFVVKMNKWTVANENGTGPSPTNPAMDYRIDWNPMFEVSEADRAEILRTQANAVTMLLNNYIMTPDEARNLLSEEWAEDNEVLQGLDDLTEEQMDILDRITLTSVGQGQSAERAEAEQGNQESLGNPRQQNGGGMPQGEQTASSNPTTDEGVEYEY